MAVHQKATHISPKYTAGGTQVVQKYTPGIQLKTAVKQNKIDKLMKISTLRFKNKLLAKKTTLKVGFNRMVGHLWVPCVRFVTAAKSYRQINWTGVFSFKNQYNVQASTGHKTSAQPEQSLFLAVWVMKNWQLAQECEFSGKQMSVDYLDLPSLKSIIFAPHTL